MSVVAPAGVSAPYRGLAPFGDSERDALLFFGRERETEIATANLIASRLTVLYGSSGVGKTSLLRAGVARRVRELGARRAVGRGPDLACVVFSSWAGEPVRALADAVEAEVAPLVSPIAPRPPEDASLADLLDHWSALLDGDLCLVLDQLEEYFVYHERGTLVDELPAVVLRPELRANVMLSLRDDTLALLDVFKPSIPNVFANHLRLDRLDRDGARAAILGPVARWNEGVEPDDQVTIEDALVEDVLAQAASVRDTARVEPTYLQLVMERLWNDERERESRVLRAATLAELGGAAAIVREHLDRALGVLDEDAQDAAARMFEHLVTPSGTKIAHRASDLAQFARLPPAAAQPVLGALGRERILRPLDDVDGDRYEIFHDVLADAILDWRRRRELERERDLARTRQHRLLGVAAGAVAALLVVATIAIFAVTQRTKADDQARHAHARELAARALLLQPVDPSTSLALALRAARLERSQNTEDVLRSSLLASHGRTILPVRARVADAAFRPDGRRIATASADGRVRVWTPAGRLVRTIDVGRGPATAVSYDATGRRLLTVGGGSAAVWEGRRRIGIRPPGTVDARWARGGRAVLTAGTDGVAIGRARDGALLRNFPASRRDVRAVLSADGTVVAAIGSDARDHLLASIFDARSGRLLHVLPRRGVSDVEFSPDGRVLAVASSDDTTTLWRPRTGALVQTLSCGANVNDISFSPDGGVLAAALANGGVRVWQRTEDTGRFELAHFFLGHTNPALHVAWSPNGQYVVSTSADRTARVRQPIGAPQGEIAVLAGHRDAVETAAFAPDGRSIVTAGDDGTARVWDAAFEQRLAPIGRHRGVAHTAAFSADGRRAVSAGEDGTARVWDVRGRRELAMLQNGGDVRSAVLNADATRVVTAAGRTARIWSGRGKLLATLVHRSAVVRTAISPVGSRVATATVDGIVALWWADGRRLGRRRGGARATDLSFTPDGRTLITAGVDGTTTIWSVVPFRPRHVLEGHHGAIVRAAMSPDGQTIVTAGADATARVWSVDGRLLRTLKGHLGPLTDAEFDATGTHVLTTSEDSDARLWDVRSGKNVLLRGTSGAVNAGAVSPDGRWVVTGGSIAAALWSAATGQLLFYLRPETPTRINDVAFSPDGRVVLASGDDGTVGLYPCDVCGEIDELEALAQHRLARERAGVRRTRR